VLLENLKVALAALWANRLRSVLTTLGIVVGVAAVIAVVSLVQGLQQMITGQLQGVGATYIIVAPDRGDARPGTAARQVKLTWEDGQAVRQKVPGIRLITPVLAGQGTVKYADRDHAPFAVLAVNQDAQEVLNFAVDQGRFFSAIDVGGHRQVAVIGPETAKELKLGRNPLGKEIYVGTRPVTVIGVMEKKGQSLGMDLDDMVYIPFDMGVAMYGRTAAESITLRIQARTPQDVEEVRDGVARLLRQRHHIEKDQPDDFRILVQDQVLKIVRGVLGAVTAAVGGVVSIALLVGGIGIMNIMLVSVTERTREIGVRKAVGARRQDLLVQFLIEAVVLSALGGAIGLALGFGLGKGIAAALPGNWPPAHVPLWAVALALGVSAAIGVLFGVYPAAKASRLDPIDALRFE
jgi:putative ABC transport system permease protein